MRRGKRTNLQEIKGRASADAPERTRIRRNAPAGVNAVGIRRLLDQSDFFRGSGAHSRELVAGICIARTAAKKEVLFTEGERGHALFLLASGAVGLYKTASDGREVVIKVVQAGEIFAEVILFEQDRYPVTAVAMAPSRMFLLPKPAFLGLLHDAEFRNEFIGMLMRKQRYLADRIRYLITNDVEERFFIFMRENYGPGELVVPTLSKKDMAAAIGTTPETYSRLLARLAGEGKISVAGKTIRVNQERRSGREPSR
jgi:CRP-like cAMP-binding protein